MCFHEKMHLTIKDILLQDERKEKNVMAMVNVTLLMPKEVLCGTYLSKDSADFFMLGLSIQMDSMVWLLLD